LTPQAVPRAPEAQLHRNTTFPCAGKEGLLLIGEYAEEKETRFTQRRKVRREKGHKKVCAGVKRLDARLLIQTRQAEYVSVSYIDKHWGFLLT
jgi:hypothetical protein